MPKLVISGTVYELPDELITIGRAPDNLIVLEDPSVSGRHAEIRLVGAAFHLKDLGSTNGTRVNGTAITEAKLAHGDRIRFGIRSASALGLPFLELPLAPTHVGDDYEVTLPNPGTSAAFYLVFMALQ